MAGKNGHRATIVKAKPGEERVELDFSDLSFGESTEFALLESQIQRVGVLQMQLNGLDKDEAPPRELVDELAHLSSPETMRQIFDAARREMARVVKAAPRSWFVSGAPHPLDFADPETYTYLRADKARELRLMIARAKQPEDVTKN
jgi:hypothetical protein